MQTIALITIGQSPRADIVNSMFPDGPPSRLIERGALDQLSRNQVRQLEPQDGEHPLVSRLRDGTEVVVAKERLMPHMQTAVDEAVQCGATLAVILCTGEFTQLSIPIPSIYPDRVLTHSVEAVLPRGALGVMLPHVGQMESMRQKWISPMRTFEGIAVSPYSASDELARDAGELRDRGAQLIVMDCMGFDGEMKRTVANASRLPTILANRLVGRIVEELTSTGD